MAGGRVFPPPIVTSAPLLEEPEGEQNGIFPVCAITRPLSHVDSDHAADSECQDCIKLADPFPNFPSSVGREDLIDQQQLDPVLKPLFERLLSSEELKSGADGYYLVNSLLVRKWTPQGESFVGEPIVQIVVPQKFTSLIMHISHGGGGSF